MIRTYLPVSLLWGTVTAGLSSLTSPPAFHVIAFGNLYILIVLSYDVVARLELLFQSAQLTLSLFICLPNKAGVRFSPEPEIFLKSHILTVRSSD